MCTAVLINWDPATTPPPPIPPAFGLIYESAIGQPRWTTPLCDPPNLGLRMFNLCLSRLVKNNGFHKQGRWRYFLHTSVNPTRTIYRLLECMSQGGDYTPVWTWLTTQKQCCGSMTSWGGSGSGSADPCLWLMDPDPDPGSGSFYFRHWPSRCQQ